MREFEITWMEKYDLKDLGLRNTFPSMKAYIKENEALRSEDFRKARFSKAIEVKTYFGKRNVTLENQKEFSKSPVSFQEMTQAISQAIVPLVENQQKIIALLEKTSQRPKQEDIGSRVIESKTSEVFDFEPPEEDWEPQDIKPFSLENELTKEKSEDNINSTFEKLKNLKKKRKKI